MRHALVVVSVCLVAGCASAPAPPADLWTALQELCGQAFEGKVVEGTESSDDAMRSSRLVMHVRSCTEEELRVPFHVGENRSRTWVLTRTAEGLRLKHDHRHEDGTPDEVTQYGGDSRGAANALSVEFPADDFTANLLPAAKTNVWTVSVDPGETFSYGLRREGTGRRFKAEFDLSRPVEAPPAPW
ncbi:MAG TPA: hypothetical protein VMO26_24295 [Vicinamibacterales bacterium]|nr:hypothetical protein [Vicinamibacterales bacterium]